MEAERHEAAALYVTDALRDGERRWFELHLAHCEQCRTDLPWLAETASVLALAIEPVEPPPALRERVVRAARATRLR